MILFVLRWPDGHEEYVSIYGTSLSHDRAVFAAMALAAVGKKNRRHGMRFEAKWEVIDVPTLH